MRTFLFIPLLVATSIVQARDFNFTKKVEAGTLQKELEAAGFNVGYIQCAGDRCRIHMPDSEKKNPTSVVNAHVYVNPFKRAEGRRAEAKALARKLREKNISPEEKDLLLVRLSELVLGD